MFVLTFDLGQEGSNRVTHGIRRLGVGEDGFSVFARGGVIECAKVRESQFEAHAPGRWDVRSRSFQKSKLPCPGHPFGIRRGLR